MSNSLISLPIGSILFIDYITNYCYP